MVGSVTLCFADLAPAGSEVAEPDLAEDVPLRSDNLGALAVASAWLMAGASSAGGAPAGSLLYCAEAALAAKTPE